MRARTAAGALSGATLLVLTVAACGGSSGVAPLAGGSSASTSAAAASAAASAATRPAGPTRTITVRISGGKVTPAPTTVAVSKGTRVVLTVTSDRDDEVHVHGYNIEKELSAGTPGTLSFVANQVGRVEVETHKSGLTLFELVTR